MGSSLLTPDARPRSVRILCAVLALALALRVGAAFWWQSQLDSRFLFGDSESYWCLAQTIARGQPYQFGTPDARVFRTPGYPVLLATLFRFVGDDPPVLAARLLGAGIGTLLVGAIYWLGCLAFDRRVGLTAAALTALYPGAIITSILVLTEATFGLMLVLQTGLLIRFGRLRSLPARGAGFLAVGLFAALATLVRPSWLLYVPLLAGVMVLGRAWRPAGWSRRTAWFAGGTMFLGLVLCMFPWWIRNARVTGHFVPTTLQAGASLYDGLGPQATGGSDMRFVQTFTAEERANPSEIDAPLEYRLDRRMRDAAVHAAEDDPARVLRLAGVKFLRMWNIWPNEPAFRSAWVRCGVLLSYGSVIVLALWGTRRRVADGWTLLVCWLPAVYLTALHLIFVSSIRYRQPLMPVLMVLAAATLWDFVSKQGSISNATARGARTV
jgi:4-amino-4-deoxy-L-arabinose transferase-like glycosyltransferase